MATIGIDLTPIQGPHRLRGVGSTVINVMRHISDVDKAQHEFVFYVYEKDKDNALELIGVDTYPNNEVRIVAPAQPLPPSIKTVRGLTFIPHRIYNALVSRRHGSKRITNLDDIDNFLQFEQDVLPPPSSKAPTTVMAYDLIPYVLESDYLWNYKTARKAHGYSRRGALKAHAKRMLYLSAIRTTMKRASKIIAISEHTKKDFMRYVGVLDEKISVCHLGVSHTKPIKHAKPDTVKRYISTSWGDVGINTQLPDMPFLLFVGGADPRRKLADLVHAFNLLRAQGHKLCLVLAGDTMLGPNSVPNEDARNALLESSYLDDVYLLGFVDETTREWLYQNAVAFVYPSRYEGFGLPILEAMQYGTPVITYQNSSISEISGSAAFFAENYTQINDATVNIMSTSAPITKAKRKSASEHAAKYSWLSTARILIKQVTS
jgi:glycosyltransferase involved in cell wall biosynthesis